MCIKPKRTKVGLLALYFKSGHRLPYRRIENWWSERAPNGQVKLTVVVHPDLDYTTYITEKQFFRFERWVE